MARLALLLLSLISLSAFADPVYQARPGFFYQHVDSACPPTIAPSTCIGDECDTRVNQPPWSQNTCKYVVDNITDLSEAGQRRFDVGAKRVGGFCSMVVDSDDREKCEFKGYDTDCDGVVDSQDASTDVNCDCQKDKEITILRPCGFENEHILKVCVSQNNDICYQNCVYDHVELVGSFSLMSEPYPARKYYADKYKQTGNSCNSPPPSRVLADGERTGSPRVKDPDKTCESFTNDGSTYTVCDNTSCTVKDGSTSCTDGSNTYSSCSSFKGHTKCDSTQVDVGGGGGDGDGEGGSGGDGGTDGGDGGSGGGGTDGGTGGGGGAGGGSPDLGGGGGDGDGDDSNGSGEEGGEGEGEGDDDKDEPEGDDYGDGVSSGFKSTREVLDRFYDDLNNLDIFNAVKSLPNGLIGQGQCPPFEFTITFASQPKTLSTNAHCTLANEIKPTIQVIMLLIFAYIGGRIILSA